MPGDELLGTAPSTTRAITITAGPNRFMLCGGERDTWCLGLYPLDERRTRVVSRWRAGWRRTPATMFWLLISEPGSFIMERKMLLGIERRVERMGSTFTVR